MPKKKEALETYYSSESGDAVVFLSDISPHEEAENEADITEIPVPEAETAADETAEVPKPKTKRKRKTEPEPEVKALDTGETQNGSEEADEEKDAPPGSVKPREDPILTIDAGTEITTSESLADIAWHEIHNAYRTRRTLTGYLGGLEKNDAGKTVAVVEYKGYRVLIPFKEMTVGIPNQLSGKEYTDTVLRYNKLFSKMMGAEIDFIIRGIDSKTRSIVASRAEAMLKKRKTFYLEETEEGGYRIYEGRVVQARVIAVAEKAIRVEIFGVECSIMARYLSWEWIGDAGEHFSVGDEVLVRILKINRDTPEKLTVKADVKSVSDNSSRDNLQKCRIQSKYVGKVTDIHKGVVFIRLTNGVNAIAHSCLDRRKPGKKDDVSFAVTHIDEDRGVAVGIITRIIKQHL